MTSVRSRSGTLGNTMRVYSRRLPGRRGNGSTDLSGLVAPARLDRKTKDLTRRLKPGDIAIIDHADLDRVSAESLRNQQVAAVVNVAPSMTGRYPNLGPQLLVEAGVPLIDDVGPDVFEKVSEGHLVRLDGDTLYLGDAVAAKGTVQTSDSVASAMIRAKAELAAQIRAFMANTVEYIGRDFEELIDGIRVPELRTKLQLGSQLGHPDAVDQFLEVTADILDRVGHECPNLGGQLRLGPDHGRGDRVAGLHRALGRDGVAQVEGVAVEADQVTLADLLEHVGADVVDQRDPGLDE